MRPTAWLLLAILCATMVPSGGARDDDAAREVQALFEEYLRLHAEKQMDAWAALFLPQAIAVRTAADGAVRVWPVAELARSIAQDAAKLESQHETFEQVEMEVRGPAGVYATTYSLFNNGQKIQQGRAYFSIVKTEDGWRIASLVWYRE